MYNTIDRGDSVELDVEDVDLEALFSESLLALGDVLSDATGGTSVTHEIEITGPDTDGLLVEWINELVRLAEEDGFVPERAYRERLEATTFRARVAGEHGIPAQLIRNVRCRSVGLRRLPDGAWSARINLDG